MPDTIIPTDADAPLQPARHHHRRHHHRRRDRQPASEARRHVYIRHAKRQRDTHCAGRNPSRLLGAGGRKSNASGIPCPAQSTPTIASSSPAGSPKPSTAEARIDHDTMDGWKAVADQQAIKWPRLRELIRPPVFYYHWGIADFDRERDIGAMRRTMRSAKSVNEVISREALGGAPHIWWRQHLEMLKDPRVNRRLAYPPTDDSDCPDSLYRLPNGVWTTNRLAAIICHNMMDLQSQASLLLWHWNLTSPWL